MEFIGSWIKLVHLVASLLIFCGCFAIGFSICATIMAFPVEWARKRLEKGDTLDNPFVRWIAVYYKEVHNVWFANNSLRTHHKFFGKVYDENRERVDRILFITILAWLYYVVSLAVAVYISYTIMMFLFYIVGIPVSELSTVDTSSIFL